MSLAEDLLNSLPEDQTAVTSADPATEPHIVINADKTVTIPEALKRILVQHDHNIETVTFDCPRYWDGHDLSQMGLRIVFQRSDDHKEPHPVENLRIDESDDRVIHFDWTISGNTTLVSGNVKITVCAKLTNAEGVSEREWHTIPNQDLFVNEGMDCSDEEIVERNPDVIEYILGELDDLKNAAPANPSTPSPDSGQNPDLVLKSPDGTQWKLTVDNAGKVGAVKVSGGDEPEVVTYTVTSGLTNVESTNPSAVVNEGESYTATLTAAEGYELDTVTVTMGGVDITATAYADGVVSIASVTGNVVITAIAVETADIDYHVMTIEDASETITAQGKTLIRGYDNSEHPNVLVPNTLNDLPVWINSSYPGTNNFNISGNIENLTFEENSTVTGVLDIQGDSVKTIKNFPATMTGLITGTYPPYTANLESVGGLEKNAALTSLNLGFSSSLKQPPVLNANAPITSLNAAFSNCKGMVYDISSWRIPSKVTNIKQLFRSCGEGITGNFLVDRNYTAENCLLALYETGVREVTVADANFTAPFRLLEDGLTNYTPLNSEAALGSTKQWKFHVPRVSAAYRAFREAYAGTVNGIMKYELAVTDGDAPAKNITFYGDSQLSPFGNVTSQMLPGMSDEVFLWNLAVRGATTESYKPVFAKFPERRGDVTVLWLMTNDTGIGADATMNNIRHYVDSLDTDKYIILGTWFFHYEELKARNEQLRTTYGSHYFDVHQYTLDNWERITGITPTEADLAAVANDTVPPSLIHSDGVHENDAGGLVIATGIKEKLLELGYIDDTWLAAE